jgi:uncharacterized protein YndB with AHSA1/START domain
MAKKAAKSVPTKVPANTGPRIAGIGSDAVRNATGKGWDEWLAILDQEGARLMKHTAIASLLHEAHKLPGWWAQMVTVGYEQARGLREAYQTSRGYEAGRTRTIGAPPNTVFGAWKNPRQRARWLADHDITIRAATPGRSLCITWSDGSRVEVNLLVKGKGRTQVNVQHSKLADAIAVERMKAYWGEQLDRLRTLLES